MLFRSLILCYLPDEAEYQELVAVILAGCPEEHRAWLHEQLKYSNKATFRQKMKDLVRAAGPLLEQLIGKGSKARDNFAEVVFDTRNYLTHYDRELEPKAARGDQLFFITNFLSIALQVALFSELGFTLEQCVTVVPFVKTVFDQN